MHRLELSWKHGWNTQGQFTPASMHLLASMLAISIEGEKNK